MDEEWGTFSSLNEGGLDGILKQLRRELKVKIGIN
jgi:hypothetical protein